MLKTRVITALCLLAAFLAAVFLLPPAGWAWLVALLSVIAGWEWGGFMKLSRNGRVALGVMVGCVSGMTVLLFPAAMGGEGWNEALAWKFGRWLYFPAVVFWLLLLPCWLWRRWPLPGYTLAAARDWVVPLARTKVPGSTPVTVPLGHSSLVVSEDVYQRLATILRPPNAEDRGGAAAGTR